MFSYNNFFNISLEMRVSREESARVKGELVKTNGARGLSNKERKDNGLAGSLLRMNKLRDVYSRIWFWMEGLKSFQNWEGSYSNNN